MINVSLVQRQINNFEDQTGLGVSGLARDLILLSLDAIERDPNPRWSVDRAELESFADGLAREVPHLLHGVAEHSRPEREISYFNVLHFLSRNLKSICPFPTD